MSKPTKALSPHLQVLFILSSAHPSLSRLSLLQSSCPQVDSNISRDLETIKNVVFTASRNLETLRNVSQLFDEIHCTSKFNMNHKKHIFQDLHFYCTYVVPETHKHFLSLLSRGETHLLVLVQTLI